MKQKKLFERDQNVKQCLNVNPCLFQNCFQCSPVNLVMIGNNNSPGVIGTLQDDMASFLVINVKAEPEQCID